MKISITYKITVLAAIFSLVFLLNGCLPSSSSTNMATAVSPILLVQPSATSLNIAPVTAEVVWADMWLNMKPISVMGSSFQLPVDSQTYTDPRGFAIDYPAEWCINNQHDLLQLVSKVTVDPSQECLTNYEVKLDITFALRPSNWAVVDEINNFQQSSASTLVEMQSLLLIGGIPAARLILNGEVGESRVLFAIINNQSICIYGYGDAVLIDAVSNTLRSFP